MNKSSPFHFGRMDFQPEAVKILPVTGGAKKAVKPSYLHIQLPVGVSEEEGMRIIRQHPNEDNLPVKVFPEPDWWGDYVDTMESS